MHIRQALVNLAATVDPAVFAIGGTKQEIFFRLWGENISMIIFYGNQKTKITLATLGNDAGIYGAAKQVL